MDEASDSISSLFISEYEITTGSIDGTVRTYDVRMGELRSDAMGHPVTSVKSTYDKNCILVNCLNNSLRLIDKEEGELLNTFVGHKNAEYKVEGCLSSDDAYVLSGSEDGLIYIWDLVDAKVVRTLTGHKKSVCSLSYHPKMTALVSSSADGTVRFWK